MIEDIKRVTKENFSEYEEKVCQMERRRRNVLAEGKVAFIVASGAYGIYFPVALWVTILFLTGNVASMVEVQNPFVRFLLVAWRNLCNFFWHQKGIAFFSFLLAILIFPIIFFLAALIARWVTARGASQVASVVLQLRGSDIEKAKELLERCRKAGKEVDMMSEWKTGKELEFSEIDIDYAFIAVPVLCAIISSICFWQEGASGVLARCGWIGVSGVLARCGWIGISIIIGLVSFPVYMCLLYLCSMLCRILPAFRIRHDLVLENAIEKCVEHWEEKEQLQARAEAKRKKEEEERRIEQELLERECRIEQDRLRGDELYRQAIAADPVDEGLIGRAADLGSRPACLHMCRQAMMAWFSGALSNSYTNEEIEAIAQRSMELCKFVSEKGDSEQDREEARFGYLTFQYLSGPFDGEETKGILTKLRDIQQSGLLPERWQKDCADMISNLVNALNQYHSIYDSVKKAFTDTSSAASTRASSSTNTRASSDTPPVKRCYCGFFTAGICGRLSTSDHTVHCDHVSNPGQCSTALLDNGLRFEF